MCNSTVLKLFNLLDKNIILEYIDPNIQKALLRLYFEREHNLMIYIRKSTYNEWGYYIWDNNEGKIVYSNESLFDYDEALDESINSVSKYIIKKVLQKKECVKPFNKLLYNIGEKVFLNKVDDEEHTIVGYFNNLSYYGYVIDNCKFGNKFSVGVYNEKGESLLLDSEDLYFVSEEQITLKKIKYQSRFKLKPALVP